MRAAAAITSITMKGGTSLRRDGESQRLAAEIAAGFKGCALLIFTIDFQIAFHGDPRPFAAVFLALFRVTAPLSAS
jgi:hypothetical protein